MKIGNPLEVFRSGTPPGGAASPEADKAKASATLAAPVAKDGNSATVTLSSGLAGLGATDAIEGSFDAKRVEEIKALIADGSFKVDAEAVANKVISSNLDALSRAKK